MQKKEFYALRLDPILKERAEAAAKIRGMSLSQFVRDAIHLYTHFDEAFMPHVSIYALLYNCGDSMFIQNVVFAWIARHTAEEDVLGNEAPDQLPEFQMTRKGLKTGLELMNELYENFKSKFEAELAEKRIQELMKKADAMLKKPEEPDKE